MSRLGVSPAVIFADPEAVVIEWLTEQWAARDGVTPSRVATDHPSEALGDDDFQIQVDLEPGDASGYPITERAQVRVVCHAPALSRSAVKAMASTTQALLSRHPGDARVAAIRIQSGRSDVSVDPDTHNLMVWFTARLALKAIPLTT